jgi:hypothetical protein
MNGRNKLVLHYAKLESLAMDKYLSLLGPFISYKENAVLLVRPLGLYLQHFTFFRTNE